MGRPRDTPRRPSGRHAPGWSRGDSNPGPPPCKGGALPAKLRPPGCSRLPRHVSVDRVGAPGLEPGTSALSGPRSNRLSYAPASPVPARHGSGGGLSQDPKAVSHSFTAAEARPAKPLGSPGMAIAPCCPRRSARMSPRPNSSTAPDDPAWRLRPPRQRWRPCQALDRLATGGPRGSVPPTAGSSLGNLTRSAASKRHHSLERR